MGSFITDSSEHSSSSPDDEYFNSSTANANLHWYYHWSSHVGYAGPWNPQMNGTGSSQWNYYFDHSQAVDYTAFESTSHPPETWNLLAQGQTNYHNVGGSTGHPLPLIPPELDLQAPIDRVNHQNEPYISAWAPEVRALPQREAQSRRPSHYSDPGLPTHLQVDATPQTFTNHRPSTRVTRPGVVTTQSADAHGIERANVPSTEPFPSAESSLSASSSPVGGHVNRSAIRCYDHGCEGRTFSSISNYRRHQRERAGQSPVCFCPRCGAVFYRRWTRDHHVERGSCLRIHRSN